MADRIYIRLPAGFCYLAAILDAICGKWWPGSCRIDARLAVVALEQALQARKPTPGWIHHLDQGVQYECRNYVRDREAAKAQISMSAKGRPRNNAQAESFMRTLKHEEMYLLDYQTITEAKQAIACSINEVYHEKRLHSSLGYRPPCEFAGLLPAGFFSSCAFPGNGSPPYSSTAYASVSHRLKWIDAGEVPIRSADLHRSA